MKKASVMVMVMVMALSALALAAEENNPGRSRNKTSKKLTLQNLAEGDVSLAQLQGTEWDGMSAAEIYYGLIQVPEVDKVCKDAVVLYGNLQQARFTLEKCQFKMCACAAKKQPEGSPPPTPEQAGQILTTHIKEGKIDQEELKQIGEWYKNVEKSIKMLQEAVKAGISLPKDIQALIQRAPQLFAGINIIKLPTALENLNAAREQVQAVPAEAQALLVALNQQMEMMKGMLAANPKE